MRRDEILSQFFKRCRKSPKNRTVYATRQELRSLFGIFPSSVPDPSRHIVMVFGRRVELKSSWRERVPVRIAA